MRQERPFGVLVLLLGLSTMTSFMPTATPRQPRVHAYESRGAEKSEGIKVERAYDPGVGRILLAKPYEYNHFTSKSCLFIFQLDAGTGSRAVVLERPTAWVLEELSPAFADSVFSQKQVFLGGEQGKDIAVLLHPYAHIKGARDVGGGIYYGGLKMAEIMLREQQTGLADHGLELDRFKFFFNYMTWGPGQLERQVKEGNWDIVEANCDAVLRQGSALDTSVWNTLRRNLSAQSEAHNVPD